MRNRAVAPVFVQPKRQPTTLSKASHELKSNRAARAHANARAVAAAGCLRVVTIIFWSRGPRRSFAKRRVLMNKKSQRRIVPVVSVYASLFISLSLSTANTS